MIHGSLFILVGECSNKDWSENKEGIQQIFILYTRQSSCCWNSSKWPDNMYQMMFTRHIPCEFRKCQGHFALDGNQSCKRVYCCCCCYRCWQQSSSREQNVHTPNNCSMLCTTWAMRKVGCIDLQVTSVLFLCLDWGSSSIVSLLCNINVFCAVSKSTSSVYLFAIISSKTSSTCATGSTWYNILGVDDTT